MIGERVEGRTGAAAGSCLRRDPWVRSVGHSMDGMDSKFEGVSKGELLFGLGYPYPP